MKIRVHRATAWALLVLLATETSGRAADVRGAAEFHDNIQPILKNYCFDCHGDGESKGKVAFDQFKSDQAVLENRELWWKALKNLRAGLMPPAKKPHPTAREQEQIAHWIETSVFGSDPQNPDPGRITLRRLNRVEYRNTIRDLLGVDFDTQSAFPPDDTGYGFDTIGDVLTLPPMLLEKYLIAAEKIVGHAVPVTAKVMREKIIWGNRFRGLEEGGSSSLSYYKPALVSNTVTVQWAGKYKLAVDLVANEHFVDGISDLNMCRLIFRVDEKELMRGEFTREGGRSFHYDFDQDWAAGDHVLAFQLEPLTPEQEQTRSLSIQITSVTVSGPAAQEHWVQADNYTKLFPREIPSDGTARRQYAIEILGGFARKAFRRPVDEKTVNRLADLAEGVYSQPGQSFAAGIAESMVAVLASPRFLFREEGVEPVLHSREPYPMVDEFSLASRLSYFLWSSMPDEELFRLAGEGRLRQNLSGQLERMLRDKRSDAFVHDFTGQWLRGRDIENWPIDQHSILAREEKFDAQRKRQRQRFHELTERPDGILTKAEQEELASLRAESLKRYGHLPRVFFNPELRSAMRRETEDVFDYVLRQDRCLLELLDSDYTFLNQRLAEHYGITNVFGDEMRRVTLPAASLRGGVLTEGTVLVVTSNPTRTSPVKRGLFILDNILGTPTPPPPPNIPPLEDAAKASTNALSLRATLALHRKDALCGSCHDRLDPLGLAFENFNAMGMWRPAEYDTPIDATGTLTTGETFATVKELKHILVTRHAEDFYRTLTEKMLTYALGRGLDYYDVETVDQIVARLEASNGRPSVLLAGVVESAPFQKCRKSASASGGVRSGPSVALNLETP